MRKLKAFHMLCLRKICGATRWMQQTRSITNERMLAFLGVPSIDNILHQNRLRWMGNVARLPEDRLPKQALFSFLPPNVGQHPRVGKQPGKRIRDAMADSLKLTEVPLTGYSLLYPIRGQIGLETQDATSSSMVATKLPEQFQPLAQ